LTGTAILYSMLPLALSSTALVVISATVIPSLALLAWLLHEESRDEATERAEEEPGRES
jgi:hypothetical protein